jgi:tRNA-2-methylthio-N6-dimethylallyladenosine synthase
MKVFIETYGCQMNVNDSEVALSILEKAGYTRCETMDVADLILINTCSVRDNAEQRVLGRLDVFRQEKRRRGGVVVGVMGCMAERLKEKLLENPAVDLVAGPDAYRDLPRLVAAVTSSGKQINTILSHEETYGDIAPVRMDREGVTAFISIMRGCNNVCSYCIVPFVRGAERSRDPHSILREAESLIAAGYKEINLLGQNVDSYRWVNPENGETVDFANLLEQVALLNPSIRIRFATSHPKDMNDAVLLAMSRHANICRHIHLPVQSGSDTMLEKMNRKYTRAHYLERIARIREILPDCAITTDVIAGFCGETEADHEATLSLMREVRYDSAFMFQYSERPGTRASRHFPDDVPAEVKTRRLNEIIAQQNEISLAINRALEGQCFEVLAECVSKRSDAELLGRTSQNKSCVFPAAGHKPGDLVKVRVLSSTSATLRCEVVE